MIRSFADQGTADLFHGKDTKAARKSAPVHLSAVVRRKLDMVNAASRLEMLRVPPNNRLELLVGDRKGQYSIRVNKQYRICFGWEGSDAYDVEVVDYH